MFEELDETQKIKEIEKLGKIMKLEKHSADWKEMKRAVQLLTCFSALAIMSIVVGIDGIKELKNIPWEYTQGWAGLIPRFLEVEGIGCGIVNAILTVEGIKEKTNIESRIDKLNEEIDAYMETEEKNNSRSGR